MILSDMSSSYLVEKGFVPGGLVAPSKMENNALGTVQMKEDTPEAEDTDVIVSNAPRSCVVLRGHKMR